MVYVPQQNHPGGIVPGRVPTPPEFQVPTLEQVEAEIRRRKTVKDPVLWAKAQLDSDLWSKQREILHALKKYKRIAVRSCHSAGKTRVAAISLLWWLKSHPPGEAFVVSTASQAKQVRIALWREVNKLYGKSGIRGRINQTELKMLIEENGRVREEIVAIGYKPDDLDDTAFQGIHARYVLVLIDEADGVATPIWDAAESLISGGRGCILAIGNPTHANTEFHACFKPNSLFHQIHISAFMTPNFTEEHKELPAHVLEVVTQLEYQENMLKKWGADNPKYKARVLGEFPDSNLFGFFPVSAVETSKTLVWAPEGRAVLGCDIGGGGDPTVVCLRRKNNARIIDQHMETDPEVTGKRIIELMDKFNAIAILDHRGIGKKTWEYVRGERGSTTFGCGFGDEARDKENFHNRKAELYSEVRDAMIAGDLDIDPLDVELIEELQCIEAKTDAKERVLIEKKDVVRKKIKRSTDRLDALVLTYGYTPTQGFPVVVGAREGPSWN